MKRSTQTKEYTKFTKRLREARSEAGLTQVQVAKKSTTTPQRGGMVSSLEGYYV